MACIERILLRAASRHEQHRRLVPLLLLARQDGSEGTRLAACKALAAVAAQYRGETVRIDGDVTQRPINTRDIEMYGDVEGNADGPYREAVRVCVAACASGSHAFVAPAGATVSNAAQSQGQTQGGGGGGEGGEAYGGVRRRVGGRVAHRLSVRCRKH